MAAAPQILEEIRASVARGDYGIAAGKAERAYKQGLRDPLCLNLLAYREEEAGRLDVAMGYLREALRANPRDPGLLHGLGQCLSRMGDLPQAVAAFDSALSARPGYPAALHHKGVALEMLGQDDEARACYRHAQAGDPGYADPVAGLASLDLRAGRRDEARALAKRALAIDPSHAAAAIHLARLDLEDGCADAARARLEGVLARDGLDTRLRAGALILLGDALDARERFDEAFAAYARGKVLQRSAAPDRLKDVGERPVQEAARLAEAASSRRLWAAAPCDGDAPARGHVFLIGFPRSGTTLLEQVLASHSDVVSLEEAGALDTLAEDFLRDGAGLDRLAGLQGAELAVQRSFYWAAVANAGIDTRDRVLLDKLPLNTLKLPLIGRLFPTARVLFAERDPRDVVLSCFRRNFGLNPAMMEFTSLETTALFYDSVMRMAEAWCDLVTQPLLRVRYESLVTDFEAVVRRICAFIEIGWQDGLTDFAAQAATRRIRTPSAAQVRRGLYADALEHWRCYAAQLADVAPLLATWIDRFGYPEA